MRFSHGVYFSIISAQPTPPVPEQFATGRQGGLEAWPSARRRLERELM